MLVQLSALASLLCVAMAAPLSSDRPSFCHNLDCPLFSVLEKTDKYEFRRYNSTVWVSTTSSGATREDVNTAMFMKLFNYIDGNNQQHVKIPMTAPVLTAVTHGQGPNCASNFTMHFMIPHGQWAAPIAPSDPSVHIVTLPPMDVYVASFGGYAKGDDYTQHVADLYDSLPSSANNHVKRDTFYMAGYDSPYQFYLRHNEVWLRRV